MPQQDFRARLQPKSLSDKTNNEVLGPNDSSNILFPLWATRGVLFPYTPAVTAGNATDYDASTFIHSNYGYNAYIRSYPRPISISAEFTAQTNDEALYLLAVIHFFRSVTKSYFGVNPYNKAGTPPPVLIFNYLGDYQFNNVPVLVKSFDYTYDASIDYVPVNTSNSILYTNGVNLPVGTNGGYTWVPTHIVVQLELDTQYVPITLRDQFNLDSFRQGKLINKGYI
jgi:hypothetical protein